MNEETTMIDVCALEDLLPERGAAALLGDRQVAVFRLEDGGVRAVQQRDPYSGANVLARGIIGSHDLGDGAVVPTLTSPLYKQVWDVDSGAVLDAAGGEDLPIDVHDAEVRGGRVLVAPAPRTVRTGS